MIIKPDETVRHHYQSVAVLSAFEYKTKMQLNTNTAVQFLDMKI